MTITRTRIANAATAAATLTATALLAGCASVPSGSELDAMAAQMIQTSFREQGIARLDRIRQDEDQAACSTEKAPADAVAARIQKTALDSVKWPANNSFIGDWREGERIAQSGRGLTWTDASAATSANGGNCYNCHQISKEEISFGTIGPSLLNYGKTRGVTDPASPVSEGVVRYTWAKLWNSRSYAACSNMPRFGHKGILDETQLRHLMALLLDPRSPINR
jgi:L-cysteine S-thiosulfotransferase